MGALDYVVFLAYMAGVFVIGLITSAKVRNSADLFAAGRQAPWWVSGLSSYMTMFSAATFVVWGGVAYRYGMVAVVINLTYGIAAILVGYLIAGRWRSLGLTTPAEFIELRFGKVALGGFTVLNLIAKMLSVGVGLYALGVMICALVPLPSGNLFQDPQTGNLSVAWTVLMLGGMVVMFTVAGGLWAVLVTDVVQFVIIMIAVCFVAPLILYQAGGVAGFAAAAPEGFFLPSRGEWTWWILLGWCAIQFMMIGAEWAFVQRYLCVSSRRAAQKVAWLFGALYLLSPVLWMLPPMVYRTINPAANPEQAYILACQAVLPPGTIGLVLAAMAAATLSGIDSQLNVFAGVLTNDLYKPYIDPFANEVKLVYVGRMMTVVLGGVLIGLALLAPLWGGAEALIVKVASLYVGPLLLPTIWGLCSRKLTSSAMWITVAISITAGLAVYGLQSWNVAEPDSTLFAQLARWLQEHPRDADMLIGLVLPMVVLSTLELGARETSPGWNHIEQRRSLQFESIADESSTFTLQASGWTLVGSGLFMGGLAWFDADRALVLALFAAVLLTIGVPLLWLVRNRSRTAPTRTTCQDNGLGGSRAADRGWSADCRPANARK